MAATTAKASTEIPRNEKDGHELWVEEGANEPARDYSGARKQLDPVETKLVKKIDFFIMPTLWIMYFFNYLDRNAIALARIDNMEEELNMTSTQYQTCVSILFVGYVLGQIPSNMLITRIRPSWYMATWMALWAVVSTLTGIAQDFKGLLLTRFFLGVTEAPFYPGALYILSIFYTRKEIATRISILFTGNVLATAFAGLIALALFEMSGIAGLSGWRWLFIIQGIATFVIAIASAFVLPDDTLTTRWLTPEERQLAHNRVYDDTVGAHEKTSPLAGFIEAARDPKLWVFVLMQHLHIGASGFKNFFPTVIETLGFNRTITLVLTCPPYLLAGFISIGWAWNSGRVNERTWHITASKALAVLGFVLGCTTLNTGARYFAIICFAIGVYAVNSVILGWVASTCGQTKEKKASALGIVNTCATISFIWNPYLWPSWDSPKYTIAMLVSAACSAGAAMLAWLMRWMLIKENNKIRQSNDETVLRYAY